MTADDVLFIVKKMCASDIQELGSATNQNTYLLKYLSRALKELAHVAYVAKVSDVLSISGDGDQTFKTGGANISDMYSPLRILNSAGQEVQKRTSFTAPSGWWKESSGNAIHTKGMSGNHVLHYIAYPADVTTTADTVQFPDAGIMGLAFYVCGLVKESGNGYEESAAMYARAKERLKVAVAANDYGRGKSSGGWVPSLYDVNAIWG